jgi:hypothetical protein
LTARLAFRTERMDGWQRNYVPLPSGSSSNNNGARDFTTGRLLVDWTPTENLKVEINLNGWKNRSDAPARQFICGSACNRDPLAG